MTQLLLINRKTTEVVKSTSGSCELAAKTISAFMLGRDIENYICVKSDDTGDRVVNWANLKNNTVTAIQKLCEEA
jgi:hypothetical protein